MKILPRNIRHVLIAALLFPVVALAAEGAAKAPLRVVTALPLDGSVLVNSWSYIQITFNGPVVALTAPTDQRAPSEISIDPPVKGNWRWIGNDAIEFTPEKTFEINTEFTVTVPKGFRSAVTGKSLETAHSWKFRTRRFEFESAIDSNKYGITGKMPMYLEFNLGLDLAACRGALTISPDLPFELCYADSAECRRVGMYTLRSDTGRLYQDRIVKMTPKEDWKRASAYSIAVNKNLKPKKGTLGLAKDTVILRRIVGDLVLKSLSQERGDSTVLVDSIVAPDMPLLVYFSNPIDWESQWRHVEFTPKVAIDSTEFSGPDRVFRIDQQISALTNYTVAFDTGLSDIFGNRLGKKALLHFSTAAIAPSVGIPLDYWFAESRGHRRIPVFYCNKDSIDLDLVAPPFEAAGKWLRYKNTFADLLALANREGWPVRRIRGVPDTTRNRRHTWKLPLDTVLRGKSGFVAARLIKCFDTLSPSKRRRTSFNQTISGYMVTNIGLTIQKGNGDYRFYASRLDNAAPLPGARISVCDSLGQTLWTGATDGEGRALLPHTSPFWKRSWVEGEPFPYVVVMYGDDWTLAGLCKDSFEKPSRRKLPVVASAFSDRGLYLPGDTVRFIAVVRADDDSLVVPRGCRASMEVSNSRFRSRADTVPVSVFGTVDYAFPITRDAPLGRYEISGSLLENDSSREIRYTTGRFQASFMVGEFRPSVVLCGITTPKDTFITGDTVPIRINGRYLYDVPLARAQGYLRMLKSNGEFSSPLFPGFSFDFSPLRSEKEKFGFDFDTHFSLDSAGVYELRIPLLDTLFRGGVAFQIYCDLTSAYDDISGSKRIIVHPGAYYIGLKPRSFYCIAGETQTVDAASVTTAGKPIAVKNLRATVFRLAEKDGDEDDESRPGCAGDSIVWTGTISTNTSGKASFGFKPRTPGAYRIMVSGLPSRIASTADFTALPPGGWRPGEDTALSLHIDKAEYRVGDTVRVLLSKVVRPARALVTTERDRVFTSQWVGIAPGRREIKIPVLPVHRSGFWVSVAAYYGGKTPSETVKKGDELAGPGWTSDRIFVKVTWREKALAISLAADKPLYAPGDEVSLSCSIPQLHSCEHEVIVWAEDEGVLSLTGYKTPDILEAMYYDRNHGVSLSDTRETLLKPFEFMNPAIKIPLPHFVKGGALRLGEGQTTGGELSKDAKTRRRFSMRPLFLSSVHADAQGRAIVRFRLPDNLTKFRIMAVAADDGGRFGAADTSIVVTKPLFLRPLLPQCLRNRDTIRIGGLLENRTDATDTASVSLSGKGLAFLEPSIARLEVPAKGRKEFFAAAVIDGIADTCRILFSAVSPKDSDAVEACVPVTPFRFPKSVTMCGTADKTKREKIKGPLRHDLGRSTLSVEATNTIVRDLEGSLAYLETYPYDCAEQMTSKILPLLLCKDVFKKKAAGFPTDSLIREKVIAYLRGLPEYATAWRGYGFSYWKGGVEESPSLTAYVLFALHRAMDCGYGVENDMLLSCYNGLYRYLRDPESRKEYDWYARQCAVAAVLSEHSRYGRLPSQSARRLDSLVDALVPLHASGSLFAKITILRILRNRSGPADLSREIAGYIESNLVHEPLYAYFEEPSTYASRSWHQTPVRTTALALQTLLETGRELPAADKIARWLLLKKAGEGHWTTTQDNAYALWALSTYARFKEPPATAFDAALLLDGGKVLGHSFSGGTAEERFEWQRPFSAIAAVPEHSLVFEKSGSGSLYYTIRMNCLPLDPVKPFDAGLRIEKNYTTLDGRPISPDSLRYREIVLMTTAVATPRERQYVVVDDPIPAGCEIINEAFNTVEQAVKQGIKKKNRDFFFSWKTWNHFEYRKEGCRVYATRLSPGRHQFTYAVRPIARGSFHLPPAYAQEMYSPEVYGRNGEGTATVR